MPDSSDSRDTELIRQYTKLKRRRKIATIACIASWLGMAQFGVTSSLFFGGGAALPGEIVEGHYYSMKGSARQEVTKRQFWFSRCSSVLFMVCWPLCGVAGFISTEAGKEIKKIEPELD